jgi:hypothetical protein
MADFLRLPMSSQTRSRFDQILDQAATLGIDPTIAASAGLIGLRALLPLTQAKDSAARPQRERYLAKAQDALRVLEHRKCPELVQQIQKAIVALHGRNNDSDVAHVTRGEIVVPLQLQNGEVLAALRRAVEPYGVPLDMLRVGSALNRINPETGAPEFGVIDWISGLFKDKDGGTSTGPASSNETEPKIIFHPPFDDPAIAADEEEAVRAHLHEFPPQRSAIFHPILGAITRAANTIKKPEPANAIGIMIRD